MGTRSTTGLTWDDLQRFPDDGLRREIIDGDLLVTPAPARRHQRVVTRLIVEFHHVVEPTGGEVFTAPFDVVFDQHSAVQPDVLVFASDAVGAGESYPYDIPDLVVEVSSPGTKGVDRIRKRALYERFCVAEYWVVDLDEHVIEAYVLGDGRYGEPVRFAAGDTVTSVVLPGFACPLERLVPPPGDG